MSNTILPLTSKIWEKWQALLGRHCAPCIQNERWLEFSEKSFPLNIGDVVSVNVMTRPNGKNVRKLCSLEICKQDLQRALDAVDD
jgi:hypothetical protein